MFQAICKIVAPIASLLGIASAEHEWKWSGQPGTPRWELLFDFDGFQYAAELAPSNGRPANIGRFSDYPCVNSMDVGGVHYVPTRHKAIVLQDFIDSGMTAFQADRAYRKLLPQTNTTVACGQPIGWSFRTNEGVLNWQRTPSTVSTRIHPC